MERATKQIRYAIDHGVNYLDTAFSYEGEAFVGKVLADGYREKVNIATKLPLLKVLKREDMDELLDMSLHNLQTDHIDYYLFHALSPGAWNRLKGIGVIEFIAKTKADGRIRHIGFHSQWDCGLQGDGRRLRLGLLPDHVQHPGRDEPGGQRRAAVRRFKRPRRRGHGAAARRQPCQSAAERGTDDLE